MTFDLAQMIADREAGTPGEWRIRINKGDDEDVCDVSICGDIFVLADLNGPQYAHQYPNARRIARVPAMEAEIIRLTARVAELERQLGGGCDANNGGDHTVIRQGRYSFCGECGESLTVVRFNHAPRAALSTPTEEPKT